MDDVYIIGVGMFRFGKYAERTIKDMAAEALQLVLADAGATAADIGAAWFSNSFWGINTGQHSIRGQVALAPLGIQNVPIQNVENACAGASSAVNGCWMGIKSGAYDVALAIGAEKVYNPDDKEGGGGGGHSPFMDIYAMAARLHMQQYGTTQEQLAIIASKNHKAGALNPLAQYQIDMSVADVMNDRLVAYPLTRAMCAPIGDGATAALLCSESALSRFPNARPLKVRASVLASGSLQFGPDEELIGRKVSRRAYEMAGLGPEDIDVAEVHDATAFGELLQCEELSFCGEGEGGPFAASGATTIRGKLPVNPSGGLECRGHPIGASGIAQLVELVTQLRGESGPRQVEGARIAMAENGGGFLGAGEAAMAIHILEKV